MKTKRSFTSVHGNCKNIIKNIHHDNNNLILPPSRPMKSVEKGAKVNL